MVSATITIPIVSTSTVAMAPMQMRNFDSPAARNAVSSEEAASTPNPSRQPITEAGWNSV